MIPGRHHEPIGATSPSAPGTCFASPAGFTLPCAEHGVLRPRRFQRAVLIIRGYEHADHDAVWDLHNRALHAVGAHPGNGPWDEDLHRVEAIYLQDGGEFLVGTLEGRVVAMGALRRRSPTHAEVVRMRVDPSLQRRGFGQAILAEIESRARLRGYRVLRLETTVRQTAAQALYEKNGYRRIGRAQSAGFEVLLYEKILA
ncbi:MAG: GNAT family N-acetyltransferase [Lentisphaeria bacterium]|nr:GNAT family N-acetyltransferase [Lentisphaeria bacterium]